MRDIEMKAIKLTGLIALFVLLAACGKAEQGTSIEGRWYTAEQVAEGRRVFGANCASCHGFNAQGTADWKQRNPDGSLPPPPLNGSAHAWHHPMSVLRQVIRDGTASMGGNMPAWGETLTEQQIDASIAYFQSQWSDEIYARWDKMNKR